MRILPLVLSTTVVLAALGIVPGCKDAAETTTSTLGPGASTPDPIAPSAAGDAGCGPGGDQPLASCMQVPLAAALNGLGDAVSTLTRITAATSGGEVLYATAKYSGSGDSTVLEIDLSDVANPVVVDLLGDGVLRAFMATFLGTGAPGELGELAVLDGASVVVVELASNTILAVDRGGGSLQHFAGAPSAAGGFFDSLWDVALFSFDAESQLCPTGDGRLFVADTGNHALRLMFGNPAADPSSFVTTLVGTQPGVAGFADGDLETAMLDAPTGLVVTCDSQLLVTERGSGSGGHRVRRVTLFGFDALAGKIIGDVATCAGDGTAASADGAGALAQVHAPSAPQVSSGGEAYWIDKGSGTLRRKAAASDAVDSPLAACGACGTCLAGGTDFTPNASLSTAISADGGFYVLVSGTSLLRRFE